MGKTTEQLVKAVAIGEKHGIPEDIILGLLTLENLVSKLFYVAVEKIGEEKFRAFFKEVGEVTDVPLTDAEVNMYVARFRKMKEVMYKVGVK